MITFTLRCRCLGRGDAAKVLVLVTSSVFDKDTADNSAIALRQHDVARAQPYLAVEPAEEQFV